MSSTPNPTWYDVLGVSRDASPDEVKAAWRHATDKFEPGSGSGQFRMFNDAADVLLDPARRRSYDESLDRDEPVDRNEPAASPREAPEDVAVPASAAAASSSTHRDLDAEKAEKSEKARRRTEKRAQAKTARQDRGRGRAPVVRASRRAIAAAVVLALLAAAAVVAAVLFALKVKNDNAVADARDEAPSAAERAAKSLFSYDYRSLDADRTRAKPLMTSDFAKKYLANFDALQKQKDGSPGLAVQSKTVVTASVLGSGVVDAEAGQARVLVYVNLVSKKASADPQIFQNRVAMTMVQDGSRWLVKNVNTY